MSTAFIRADSLYAWKGSSLLIVTARGDCHAELPLAGYYYREARFLQTLQFEFNGHPPWLCEAAMTTPDTLAFNYVHPEVTAPGGGGTGQSGDEEGIDPVLPTWAPEIVLRDLRVGAATVSLRFWRDADGRSTWDVLHLRGPLRIVRQPAPESLSAGWADRVYGAMETLVS